MQTVKDIRKQFIDLYNNQEVVEHSGGDDMLEIIGAHFEADEETIFADVNHEYVEAEIEWYSNQSTNINDIYKDVRKPPKAWTLAADHYGNINSNYGYLIFSDKYLNQYNKVVSELMRNPRSRRATMVYTRPSIWHEYDEGGKSDFICTNAQTFYIRDGKLHMLSQMRSNDVVFGYKNDYAWAQYLMDYAIGSLAEQFDVHVEKGDLTWQVMNLHVYERHFDLVK